MRERSELILKIVCGVLAAFLFFQIVRLVIRANPMHGVRMPDLPTVSANPDQTAAKGTNVVAGSASGTNATNSVTRTKSEEKGTNASASQVTAKSETNAPVKSVAQMETNAASNFASNQPETNIIAGQASDKTRTNSAPGLASEKQGTNAIATRALGKTGSQPILAQSASAKLAETPPLVQARIDRIAQSEILAPFIRPMPMALLGIAGKDAFLRAPNGQTGLVKEGDELGGIKLLKIGINRVLVEQAGEKKELTIFSGFGGESLLPKQIQATNETIIKSK